MIGSHLRSNLVAYLALFVALGGTAWAATKISSKDIKRDAVRAKHVKKDAIRADEIRANAVGSAEIADNQVTGADVAEGTLGEVPRAAVAGGAHPIAFANVNSDGTVELANSKGITNANVEFFGSPEHTYCFRDLPFDPRGAQVTLDYSGSNLDDKVHFDVGSVTPCAPGDQAFVWGVGDEVSFYIAFYR
jgi:hypothetical protein